jgi:hypothetical protein
LLFGLIINSGFYANTLVVPEDGKLERWIIRCKNSMQRVKTSIDMYFTVRTIIPELMSGWDTTTKWFRAISDVM